MRADPGTRRARSVVLLVVLTVALPSLLLTALGAAAVSNEEAAARKRLEKVYQPLLKDLAVRFNAELDLALTRSEEPLGALVEWAIDGDEAPASVRALVRETPYATNFFVLGPEGEVLVPRVTCDEDPRDRLSARLLETLETQPAAKRRDDWRCLLEGRLEPDERCPARFAALLDERGRVTSGAAAAALREAECERWASSAAGHAALALFRTPLEEVGDKWVEAAEALARQLGDPLASEPPLLVELVARRVAAELAVIETPRAEGVRHVMMSIAERPALLAYLTGLSHPRDRAPALGAVGVEDWRRVISHASIDGYVTGYELVATAMEPMLAEWVEERFAEEPIVARLFPVQPPRWWMPGSMRGLTDDEMDAWVASWVLLKRTDLAWNMVATIDGGADLLSLDRSRSGLYLWALILIAGALLLGIAYTVRAVVQEARLSRLKSDFVSSVSHDLRTPLTSIRMFTETLLLGRAASREEEREFLQVIADETERLSRLTERILDFSRMEAGRKAYQFAPHGPGELIKLALAACRPMIEEGGFEVATELEPGLPSIEADKDAIIEVLINLLTNALKYSPTEKRIVIRAARSGADRVAISVIDRGIGIPKAEQQKIFEKFYRVECRRTTEVGGSGIGLSLVEHIVGAHRGTVSIASRVGEGSTFTVELPAAPGAPPEGEAIGAGVEVGTWRPSSS